MNQPDFDDLSWQLQQLRDKNRLRQLVPRQQDGVRLVDPSGHELINFGGNDYLGLAADRKLVSSASNDADSGSIASALVCGWTDRHQQLADKLAALESTESAVVFPSGFAACSGTVATLADEGDLILSDALNHASLIDGCRLSRAQRVIYPHRDIDFLTQTLQQRRSAFERVWIVTDAVFSMDGHVAPLEQLTEIAQRFDTTLIVDEAHATGVLGDTGSGLCEALGVKDRVAIRIGTLSKALGGQGGFVVAPQVVIDYLVNRCRTLIFSTALAPAAVESALVALDLVHSEPQRRLRVQGYAQLVREKLSIKSEGIESSVPIIPVPMQSDAKALAASAELAERGYYVPAIRPPTVPEGDCRLRLSLSAAHNEAMIRGVIDAIGDTF